MCGIDWGVMELQPANFSAGIGHEMSHSKILHLLAVCHALKEQLQANPDFFSKVIPGDES